MFVSVIYPSPARDHRRPGPETSPLRCESYQASLNKKCIRDNFQEVPIALPALSYQHLIMDILIRHHEMIFLRYSARRAIHWGGKFSRLTNDRSFSNHIYTGLNTADCNWVPAVCRCLKTIFTEKLKRGRNANE